MAGTPVLAQDGLVPIEKLRVGDRVRARSRTDGDLCLVGEQGIAVSGDC